MYGQRITDARKHGGYNLDDFSLKMGVSKRTLQNYEKDTSEPSASFLKKVADLCQINEWWIYTGNGDMLEKEHLPAYSDLVELPYFEETYASAGGGSLNYNEQKKPMAFDKSFLEKQLNITIFKNLHIINAVGNSMEPTIQEGELLFINPFENEFNNIKDGGIYVIICENSTFVKRVSHNPINGVTKLISDNSAYPEMEITGQEFESCTIMGRVVGHFSNI